MVQGGGGGITEWPLVRGRSLLSTSFPARRSWRVCSGGYRGHVGDAPFVPFVRFLWEQRSQSAEVVFGGMLGFGDNPREGVTCRWGTGGRDGAPQPCLELCAVWLWAIGSEMMHVPRGGGGSAGPRPQPCSPLNTSSPPTLPLLDPPRGFLPPVGGGGGVQTQGSPTPPRGPKYPPLPLAQARPCLSTGWALNRCC